MSNPNRETTVAKYTTPQELVERIFSQEETSLELANKEKAAEILAELNLTEPQLNRFVKHMGVLKSGFNAVVPLTCRARKCLFFEACPIVRAGAEPQLGTTCIVEFTLFNTYRMAYIERFNIREEEIGPLLLVNELAELDIYDMRATILLSLGDTALKENGAGDKDYAQGLLQTLEIRDDTGQVISTTYGTNPVWSLKERIKNRKMRILTALVGTRQEEYKKSAALGVGKSDDIAKAQKSLAQKVATIQKELQQKKLLSDYTKEINNLEV